MSTNATVAATAARGTLITLLGNVVATVIGAVGVLVIANLLTPAELGQYALALLPVTVLNLLTGWGIDQALPRFLVHSRTRRGAKDINHLIYTGLLLKALVALGLALIQGVFADTIASLLNRPQISEFIRLSALGIAVQPLCTTILTIFAGLDRMTRRALVHLLQMAMKAVVSPALVVLGWGVSGAIIGHVTSFGIAVAVGLSALCIVVTPPPFTSVLHELVVKTSQMIRFGFPLFAGTLASMVMMQIQGAVLPWYVSDVAIGNYQVAAQFRALITVFTSALGVTLYPSFSRFSYVSLPVRTRQAYRLAVRYSALIVIPLTLLLIAVAQPMVATLYTAKYPSAASYFAFLIAPMLFVGLGLFVAPAFLTSQGDARGAAATALIRAITGLALAPLGLHLGGVIGFLITHLVAYGCGIAFIMIRLRQRFHINADVGYVLKLLSSALGATLAALGVAYLGTEVHSSIILIGGTLVYCTVILVLLPVTGAITEEDFRNLRDFTVQLPIVGKLLLLIVDMEQRLVNLIKSVTSDV